MDIKILGAGPGGLITGLKLLEAGYEPTVMEKNEEIVSTLCGEGLSADTLSRVPFRDWSEYAPQTFDHATFIFPGGYKAYTKRKCYTMDRTPWMRAMAKEFEKRGGRLEMGRKISSTREIGCDLLIGADGPFSVAAKEIGNRRSFMAGVQYRIRHDYKFDGMEFFLDKGYSREYSWIFAKGRVFNVGLLGGFASLDRFVKEQGIGGGEIVDRQAFNIPFFGTKVQEGNIILTGDAAGITNPLTKGGMAAIVHTADIIVDCLERGRVSEYQKRVFSHPVMAKEYREGLRYFMELTNEKLKSVGKMLNGMDLARLDKKTKLKIILAAIVKPRKMRTLMKALHYANIYSW